MKIKMLQTVKCIGGVNFHKGRTYSAVVAQNIPGWKKDAKIFVKSYNSQEISALIRRGDYEIVNGTEEFHFGEGLKMRNEGYLV